MVSGVGQVDSTPLSIESIVMANVEEFEDLVEASDWVHQKILSNFWGHL